MNGRIVLVKENISDVPNTVFLVEYDITDNTYTAQVYEEADYFCLFETVYEAESIDEALWLAQVLTPYPLPDLTPYTLAA